MFHSDHGSQYTNHAVRAKLAQHDMAASMSRKGNCWDNASTESFFNSLKNERAHGANYATREQAAVDLFEYMKVFYNHKHRHFSLNYLSSIHSLLQSTNYRDA